MKKMTQCSLFFEVGELFLYVFEVCKRGSRSKFLFNWKKDLSLVST